MIREFIVWIDRRLGRSKKKMILRPRNYVTTSPHETNVKVTYGDE